MAVKRQVGQLCVSAGEKILRRDEAVTWGIAAEPHCCDFLSTMISACGAS